jgi:hypothetical protein
MLNSESQPPLAAAPLQQQWQTNSMKVNYATSKAGGLPLGGASGTIDAIVKEFDKAFPKNAIQNASTKLGEQMENIQSLSQFLDAAICTILTAAEDVVLLAVGAAEGLINVVLSVAADGIDGLPSPLSAALTFLDTEIDIPIISALYQKITGSPLTILDLLCLIIALPCTILYKLFFGGSTALPPFTTAQVQKFCSSSFTWPWLQGSGSDVRKAEATAAPSSLGAELEEVLPILVNIVGIFVGAGTAITDLSKDPPTPARLREIKLFGWGNVVCNFLEICIYQPWDGEFQSAAGILNIFGSLFPLLPWCTDVFCMVATEEQAKFIPLFGPGILTAFGAVQLGIGIATAVEMNKDGGYNGLDMAGAILNCASPLGKVGTYVAAIGPTAATVAGVEMAVLDLADDLVTAILSMISAAESGKL